jgi:hypothetical protein
MLRKERIGILRESAGYVLKTIGLLNSFWRKEDDTTPYVWDKIPIATFWNDIMFEYDIGISQLEKS